MIESNDVGDGDKWVRNKLCLPDSRLADFTV